MRLVEVCAGIGGFSLAAEWAGIEVVGQVEIDPYCVAVLEKHWPQVERRGDIREVVGDEFGSVDILVGGIPCQPWSVAGKQRGARDDRHLWPEMRRLVEVLQPAWVLVENVAGFARMALDDVCADLDARGYEVGACVLPAAAIGAPHLRERVFVVAHANSSRRERWQGSTSGRNQHAHLQVRQEGATLAEAADPRELGDANRHDQRGYSPIGRDTLQRETHAGTSIDGSGDGAHLADSAERGSRRRRPSGSEGQPSLSSKVVAHTRSSRRGSQQPHLQTWQSDAEGCGELSNSQREGLSQRSERSARHALIEPTGVPSGQTEPRMGGESDGLPRRMDGGGCPRHPWPVGPHEAQPVSEAPRTITGSIPYRASRLKALGNAVVPQVVYPILAAIVAVSEQEVA